MKTFARLLALLLALLMLTLTVVACGGDGEDDLGNSAEKDEFGREGDDLSADLNYKNDEIRVLGWTALQPEFDIEQITSDNVSNALYERNGEIERRLNVTLKFTIEESGASYMKQFVSVVQRVYDANTHDFDLIGSYSRSEGMLAIQGYLVDLKTIENSHINLDKPWWPDNVIDTVSIGDSMYFISGDASPNTLHQMQVLYFNKNLLNTYWNAAAQEMGFEADIDEDTKKEIVSPASRMLYDMAYKGTWTIDEIIKITRGANGEGTYKDIGDAPNTKDYMDQFGFTSTAYQIDSFYTGANLRLVEHTDDGSVLKISEDYGSFKAVKLISKLGDWFKEQSCWTDANSHLNIVFTKSFDAGKAVFIARRACEVQSLDVEWDYGVLPMPKYDLKQANYYTCMGNPFTLYGIFADLRVRDNDRSGTLQEMTAILECWGSETYRLVTPEVFEVNMQLKYADTQYETDMFEIIRSSAVFDLGRIFANDLVNMSELPSKAAVYGASWATSYGAYKTVLTTKLEKIVDALV